MQAAVARLRRIRRDSRSRGKGTRYSLLYHLFSLMRTMVKYMKTVNHHSGNALAYAIRDDIIRGSLSGMVVPVSVRVKVCDR